MRTLKPTTGLHKTDRTPVLVAVVAIMCLDRRPGKLGTELALEDLKI